METYGFEEARRHEREASSGSEMISRAVTDVADERLLTLRTRKAAVAEAHVRAMATRPSRVIVYGTDGSVEEQTEFGEPT